MGYEKQNQAYLNLFLAIIEENGYYDKLREVFIKDKGFNYADMASMLFNNYKKNVPEGLSPYWYMDSLEDTLNDMEQKDIDQLHNIAELVDVVWDKMRWKE